jgi:hypothetical protein
MDDKNRIIRELEDKKRADIEARNRLLRGLGEALVNRIGDGESFPEITGETPGGILVEYRLLQKEIAESGDIIKGLEADIVRLRELESAIFSKEKEQVRFEKELEEAHVLLGEALLKSGDADSGLEEAKLQEGNLLAKIEELETRLGSLEGQERGVLGWLGRNAQLAVSKTLLLKNRSALQRVYRNTGKQYLADKSGKPPDGTGTDGTSTGETAQAFEKALNLTGLLSAMAVDIAMLKGERRNTGDLFGPEGSPSRRIQGLEKHILHVKGEFPGLYLRFGLFAAESGGKEAFASVLKDEDDAALEEIGQLKSQIARRELEIEKIKAAISIDSAYAEIEKLKRDIQAQLRKIASAEEAITGMEKTITQTEQHIEELQTFIRNNE